jgi:hypothetical protein
MMAHNAQLAGLVERLVAANTAVNPIVRHQGLLYEN